MKKLNMLLCAGLLVLNTACSTKPDPSSPTPETKQNSIVVAVGGQITTLDPGFNTETVNNYILAHTVSCLMTKVRTATSFRSWPKVYSQRWWPDLYVKDQRRTNLERRKTADLAGLQICHPAESDLWSGKLPDDL